MDPADEPRRYEAPSLREGPGRDAGGDWPQDYRLGAHAARGLLEWAQEHVDRDAERYRQAVVQEGVAARAPLHPHAIALGALEHLERWLDHHGGVTRPQQRIDDVMRTQIDDGHVQRLAATASAAMVKWAQRECDTYAQSHPDQPAPRVDTVVRIGYTKIAADISIRRATHG